MSEHVTPVLSILLITHNQCELLKRCCASVLEQKLNVPFELVISDDRSSDGTEEYVKELTTTYEGLKHNLVAIKYVRCNSDECAPLTTSDRCGWNKLNAWRNATGKYMVNIDADDYLRSNDIYQLQVDMLEAHPECSMCMQRSLAVTEGDSLYGSTAFPVHPSLVDGAILSPRDFILDDLRGLNPTYMIRRHPEDDIESLYGKHYDDTVITYHHLQYGPVIFVDRADYVWVQYPKSISHDMTRDDELLLYGLLPLHHATMIPSFRYLFLKQGLRDIIHMFKFAPFYPNLSPQYKNEFFANQGFIYRFYTEEKHSLLSYMRYYLCRTYLLAIKRLNITGKQSLNLAERLLCS